jgi:hypothetical protein
MNKIAKTLMAIMASSSLLFGTTSMAVSQAKDPQVCGDTASSDKKLDLLFVVKVKTATLAHVKDREYTLSFKPSDTVDGVLTFSDRPHRVAFRMSYAEHVKLVTESDDSFMENHPNIVLSWAGPEQPPIVFEVMTAAHGDDFSELTLQRIYANKSHTTPVKTGTFKDMQFFVDSVTMYNSCDKARNDPTDPNYFLCRQGIDPY